MFGLQREEFFPVCGVHYVVDEKDGEFFWEGIGDYSDQFGSVWEESLEEAIADAELMMEEVEEEE